MKTILSALKLAIPTAMTTITSCYVIADPDLPPSAVRYPWIGLKDGKVIRNESIGKILLLEEEVRIYIYTQLLQNSEASIMGVDNAGAVSDIKGLLEYEDDLHALLDHNNLAVTGVIHSFCSEEYPSETMEIEGTRIFIQRKGCSYIYNSRIQL